MVTKNGNILLKLYNKTTITKLGTCTVEVEHKNNRKKCECFVVPRNRQALLDMPCIDAINIMKININAIGSQQTRGSNKCCANMHTVQAVEPKQETVRAEKCYTNMDSISKSNNKAEQMVKSNSYKTEYFLSGPSYESDKKRITKTTQKIHKDFEDVFNGIWCFNGTISLQIKPDSKPNQVPLRCMVYTLQKPFQEELERLQNRT